MKSQELELQNRIINRLIELDLYPYSVIFTFAIDNDGILSITFFTENQLDTFLELLEYNIMCDKSGVTILKDNFTILLSGTALVKFYVGKLYEND